MPSGFSGAQVNLDMLLPLQPCSSLLSTGSALQCKTENFSRQRCKLTSVFLLLLPLLLLLLLYDGDLRNVDYGFHIQMVAQWTALTLQFSKQFRRQD